MIAEASTATDEPHAAYEIPWSATDEESWVSSCFRDLPEEEFEAVVSESVWHLFQQPLSVGAIPESDRFYAYEIEPVGRTLPERLGTRVGGNVVRSVCLGSHQMRTALSEVSGLFGRCWSSPDRITLRGSSGPSRVNSRRFAGLWTMIEHSSSEKTAERLIGGSATSSSTEDVRETIVAVLRNLSARDEEDDAQTEAAVAIDSLVGRFGARALLEIHALICEERVRREVAEVILMAVGDTMNTETHECRRWLLERILRTSPRLSVRDAANIGLALMDDPRSINTLKTAIEKEESALLRRLFGKTLTQLEKTRDATTTEASHT